MNYSYRKIAHNLNIAKSTATRVFQRFHLTGSVNSYKRPEQVQSMRKLDRSDELYIVGLIFNNPTMYIHEICQMMYWGLLYLCLQSVAY